MVLHHSSQQLVTPSNCGDCFKVAFSTTGPAIVALLRP